MCKCVCEGCVIGVYVCVSVCLRGGSVLGVYVCVSVWGVCGV